MAPDNRCARQSRSLESIRTGRRTHTMKLIGSLTSPYVRKVRIVMAEKKLDYQFVLEDVWASDTILKIQPARQGAVPGDGRRPKAVFDSRVIVEYVDTLSPVGKLIPPTGRERVEVRTWEALADGVLDARDRWRAWSTPGPARGEAQRSQAWIDRQMSKVHAALKAMSQGLGEKPWCSGIHFSLADIAVGCALGYLDFRFAHIDWRGDYPNLGACTTSWRRGRASSTPRRPRASSFTS